MNDEHFWYDGHHGHIECTGRERYVSYLDGDEFDKGGHAGTMRDDLLTEMKYRSIRSPDFGMVCHGLLSFLDNHVPGRNGENSWVLMDSVQEEVILNDWVLCLEASYGLNNAGYIEITKAYDTPNYQFLLRPNTEAVPEPKELSDTVPKLWTDDE